jgi:hypothetical protein
MAGVEDMQHTVVLDREQHIARVMRCCCDLRSPALESAIIGCRLHRRNLDEAGQPTTAARDEILAFFARRLASPV